MDRYSILVLALGNEIMGDDAVGLAVARPLLEKFGEDISIIEAPVAGFALIDFLEGYTHVLILDSAVTGKHPAGSVVEFSKEDFQTIHASSPHFVGIPEAFSIAKKLNVSFPDVIKILAMEVVDPYQLREGLSPVVEESLPKYIEQATEIVAQWIAEDGIYKEYFEKPGIEDNNSNL